MLFHFFFQMVTACCTYTIIFIQFYLSGVWIWMPASPSSKLGLLRLFTTPHRFNNNSIRSGAYGIIYLVFCTRIVLKPFVVQNKSSTIDVVRLRVNVQYFCGKFSFQIHIIFEVKMTRHLFVSIYFFFFSSQHDTLHLKRWAWQYFFDAILFTRKLFMNYRYQPIPSNRIRCYTLSKYPNLCNSTSKIFRLKGFLDFGSSHPIHYVYWNYFCYFFILDDFFSLLSFDSRAPPNYSKWQKLNIYNLELKQVESKLEMCSFVYGCALSKPILGPYFELPPKYPPQRNLIFDSEYRDITDVSAIVEEEERKK